MSSDMTERLHALYRFFDASGDLLYIGITLNPAGRWKRHREDKPWWEEIADITLETYPDRPSVLEAERTAIIAEHPRYNKTHNTDRPADRPSETTIVWICGECGEDVAGDGYLQVGCTGPELAEIERAHRQYEERRLGRGSWVPVDWDEVFALPRPAQWQAVHKGCDRLGDASPHWIETSDAHNYRDILIWTCGMGSLPWLQSTNWFAFVDRAVNACSPPIERKPS